GRPQIDRTAGAGDAALLAIEFDVAIGEHGGQAFGARAAQQAPDPRQQFRHRERLDDVIVGAGGKTPDPLAFLAARGQHDDGQLPGTVVAKVVISPFGRLSTICWPSIIYNTVSAILVA